jgi:hypothetical protein
MLKIITFWPLIKLELFFNSKMQFDTIRTQIQQVLIEKIPKNYAQIEVQQNARTCTVISSSHNGERLSNNVVFILRNVHQVCLALN